MITLKELTASGAFAPKELVRKEISFDIDGQTCNATIHVKALGIGDYEAIYNDKDDKKSQTASAISEAILLGENGTERLSFEQAFRLKPEVANAMLTAFGEVNNPKKASADTTNSSVTSASPSAE